MLNAVRLANFRTVCSARGESGLSPLRPPRCTGVEANGATSSLVWTTAAGLTGFSDFPAMGVDMPTQIAIPTPAAANDPNRARWPRVFMGLP